MGRVSSRYSVLKMTAGRVSRLSDSVSVEEPLELRINGTSFAVTMRTPGDDVELVHGLLHAEGIIAARADVVTARYCLGSGPDGLNTYNVLDVQLAASLPDPVLGLRRNVLTSSACGVCGTTSIDQVLRDSRHPIRDDVAFDPEVVQRGPERLREHQRVFAKTGGLHAAGLMSADGELVCVREDVGRHNAVDKVIGWALLHDRLPLSELILVVSGRASFELTQKAAMAGIPVLAAVSAPSSLAVDLARQTGVTLIGFVRGDSMNIYAHPERVCPAETTIG